MKPVLVNSFLLALSASSLVSAHNCKHHHQIRQQVALASAIDELRSFDHNVIDQHKHHHEHGHHKHHHREHDHAVASSILPDTSSLPSSWLGERTCPTNASSYPSFNSENVTLNDNSYWSYRDARGGSFSVPIIGGLAWYDTIAINEKNDSSFNVDVVASRLLATKFGAPTVGISYFADKHSYNWTTPKGNFTDKDVIIANAVAGQYSSASILLFNRIIEYADLDGDKKFNYGVDKIVSSKNLSNQSWDTICDTLEIKDMKGLTVFNASTLDKLNKGFVNFSLQVEVTNVVGKLNDWVITPRQLKWGVEINNYPYKGYNNTNDTYLALEVYMLSRSSNHSEQWNVTISDALSSYGVNSIIGSNGNNTDADIYLNWKGNADVTHVKGNGTVVDEAKVEINVTETSKDDYPEGYSQLLFFGHEYHKATKKVVYYSFTAKQPRSVRFTEATLGAGKDANAASSFFSSRNVAIAVGVIVLLSGIFGISWFAYRYYDEKRRRESALLEDDHGSYQRLPGQA